MLVAVVAMTKPPVVVGSPFLTARRDIVDSSNEVGKKPIARLRSRLDRQRFTSTESGNGHADPTKH